MVMVQAFGTRLAVRPVPLAVELSAIQYDAERRALACAWHIVCGAGVTDPKLVVSCLVRLGTADLPCGCRPTAIAASRRTRGRDTAVLGERLTLDQALAERVTHRRYAPAPRCSGCRDGHELRCSQHACNEGNHCD